VLAQAAIAHAQFETIHPFPDGNGRTGRAIIQAMLRAGRVTHNTTIPVSAGLLRDLDAYFGALDAYRAGRPEAIVEAVAEAAFAAINNGRRLVADIRAAAGRWNAIVVARSDSSVHLLKEYLLSQPVVNVKTVAGDLAVSEIAAAGSIARLEESGVLTRTSADARNRLWQATEILDALDAFAERARRARA
jgi:Fic family protein